MERGEAIRHTWVTRQLKMLNVRVKDVTLIIRSSYWNTEMLLNDQRKVYYQQRNEFAG